MNKSEKTKMLIDMGFKIPDNHAELSIEELIDVIVRINTEELTDVKWVEMGDVVGNMIFQNVINTPFKK